MYMAMEYEEQQLLARVAAHHINSNYCLRTITELYTDKGMNAIIIRIDVKRITHAHVNCTQGLQSNKKPSMVWCRDILADRY